MPKAELRKCLCGGTGLELVFSYNAPPPGEPSYAFAGKGTYARRIIRCSTCGHFLAIHDMDTRSLYEGDYDSTIYGPNGIQAGYERILALDPARSDNTGRVRRVISFLGDRGSVLDVGSGLCVFLHRMKEAGWRCVALDPDSRAAAHARDTVGIEAHHGDFISADLPGRFGLITFNKVLEHVSDPIALLSRAARFLEPDGTVYVEVPDGEVAGDHGAGREEFFVDHLHVFSAASLAILANRAGFRVRKLERLTEPSGKFTLFAFLSLPHQDSGR